MVSDIRNLFEHKEEDSWKPVKPEKHRIDRNKILSVEKYLDEFIPYLKDIINNLRNLWKTQ